MINKILVHCILLAVMIGSMACSPVTSTVTEIDTTTMTAITTMTTSPSTISSTISTTIPAFYAAVGKASQDSVSAKIEWSAKGNEVSIKSDDPRFVELLGFLENSTLKRITSKTVITTENGTTTTIQRTIPYAWGYIITFSLEDSSSVKFNCSIDSIWFETDQAIYETSFSNEFKSFLDMLIQQPIEVVSVSSPYKPGDTITPAGPKIEITLKNISNEPVISLTALLIEEGGFNSPWTFNFNVALVNPLLPGQSTSVTNILIGGGFGGGIPYSLAITGVSEPPHPLQRRLRHRGLYAPQAVLRLGSRGAGAGRGRGRYRAQG